MNKNLIWIAIIAITSSTLLGCKKGENDPFLSLKSRKARITGEWELSSASITLNSSVYGTQTYVVSDGQRTISGIENGVPVSQTDTYSEKYTFKEDYTFEAVITAGSGASIETTLIKGSWAFSGKMKSIDLKNKEAIVLNYDTHISDAVEFESNNSEFDRILVLDKLSSKEWIQKIDESVSNTIGFNNSRIGTRTYKVK